jgi:hypothetical protein
MHTQFSSQRHFFRTVKVVTPSLTPPLPYPLVGSVYNEEARGGTTVQYWGANGMTLTGEENCLLPALCWFLTWLTHKP